MRIPHSISGNVVKVYRASAETRNLVNELHRRLKAENDKWDASLAPSLATICVKVIANNFKERQHLSELPQEDRDLLLETLSPNLPLTLTVPLITADIYWQRCALARWKSGNYVRDYGDSWQRLYLERHVQQHIELLTCDDYDLPALTSLLALCSPHVRRLRLGQLQPCRGPEGAGDAGEDECSVEEGRVEHINMLPVLKHLQRLEVLDIVFGVRECGMDFAWNLFQFSLSDCRQLGLGLEQCKQLVTFRLHRSNLDDTRLITLLQHIARNKTIKELDFSHCNITDVGAMALGKVIVTHPTLNHINLTNNKIGSKGAHGLAYALRHSATPLDSLDLRLNTGVGDAGAAELFNAVARGGRPRRLVLAACGLTDSLGELYGNAIAFNESLQWLDLSSNRLGEVSGKSIELAMKQNHKMLHLDLRRTDVPAVCAARVVAALRRNNNRNKKTKPSVSRRGSTDRLQGASRLPAHRMSSYTTASGKSV